MARSRTLRASRRGGIIGWAIAAFVVALFVIPAIVWTVLVVLGRASFTSPGMMYGGPGWFFFPFGLLLFLLVIFAFFRFAFWAGHPRWRRYGYYAGPWGGPGWHDGDSQEILRRRYARGEITRDQYAQMRRDLEAPPPVAP